MFDPDHEVVGKRGWRIGQVAVLVVVLLLAVFNVQHRGGRTCRTCRSGQGFSQWRIGFGLVSIPILPELRSEVHTSHYARSFGLVEHEHEWRGGGFDARMLFGTVTVVAVCGGPSPTHTAQAYENLPEYRSFLHRKLERGELTADELRTLVLTDGGNQSAAVRAHGDQLFDEFVGTDAVHGL